MKSVLVFATLCISLAASVSLAKSPRQVNFTGAWTISWNHSATNINHVTLRQGAGVFTGTYINDKKEKCPIVGRMSSPAAVTLTIVCPGWNIKADGVVENSKLVSGSYIAYETSSGTFTMSRK